MSNTARVLQVNNHRDELLARAELVAYGVVYPTGETRMAMEVIHFGSVPCNDERRQLL